MRVMIAARNLVTVSLCILGFSCSALAAQSKNDRDDAFTKYEYYHSAYEVNADGTHVESHEWALRVLTEQGVEDANSTSISYTERLQDAEILEAYTLKPDGRRIDAPPNNYQVSGTAGRGSADPVFSDQQSKTVVFPEVAVGDLVVFSYRRVQKEALFPGHFTLALPFSRDGLYDDVQVRLSAPQSLPLRVFSRDLEGGEKEARDGRRNWSWTFQNQKRAKPDRSGLSWLNHGPIILASTFPDYAALGAAYEDRARPKAAVTERVRELAADLTKDANTPRTQVKAFHEWVSKNIRFAGNCVGAGSVVPHDVERVLTNRMGDCKDHTVLMQALMEAKGIASTSALVQSGTSYALPELPVVAAVNHVMNYIPSLDLFVDATAENTPFGSLPAATSNKPVVLTGPPFGQRTTPPADYRSNWVRLKTKMRFQRDSSAQGETSIEAGGQFASGIKPWFDYMQPKDEEEVVRRALAQAGFNGTGTLIRADTSQVSDTYRYGSRYRVEEALNLPGPGAIYVYPPFPGPGSIGQLTRILNEVPLTTEFVCSGGRHREEFVYSLPGNAKILAIPRGARFDGKHTSYKSTYTRRGNAVSVVRVVEDRVATGLCLPELEAEYRAMAKVIFKDLRSQVVYR